MDKKHSVIDEKKSVAEIYDFNYNIPHVMSTNKENPYYLAYRVINECFIPFRNFNSDHKVMTEDNFTKFMSQYGFVLIRAQSNNKIYTYGMNILLLSEMKYEQYRTSANFEKVKKLIPELDVKDKTYIVFHTNPESKKTLFKKIYNKYSRENIIPMRLQDFYLAKPLKHGEPKYSIITSDINEYIKKNKYTTKSLSVLFDTDPAMLWIGIEPGQYVRLARSNGNVGYTYEYKQVIHKLMT
jgi:hypothetical protein